MEIKDLIGHLDKTLTPPMIGRLWTHIRHLPIFFAPEDHQRVHSAPHYFQSYTRDRAGEDAWEIAAAQMMAEQQALPPPGGVTADSKPDEESEDRPDGPISLDRS